MSMPNAVLNVRRHDGGVAEPDPAAKPRRRLFSAEYKLAVLAEYEAAADGDKGAVLRREGLYSSHITEWRQARDAGGAGALVPHVRQPQRHPAELELERLRKRHQRTEAELARTRLALDIMGKAHALLEQLAESAGTEPPSTK
jgi:transposase-like protein